MTRLRASLLAVAVVASACGGGTAATTTTTTLAPTTTTSTTLPPTTTTTALPRADIEVDLEGDAEAAAVVGALYAWIGDRANPRPEAPDGLLALFDDLQPTEDLVLEAALHSGTVDEGRVGVVTAGDDVILLADEGDGWKVVGAHLARWVEPWYGENVRHVLVLGTDRNTGESQPVYRSDSIHILSANVDRGAGTIVGFPRDTWVETSYGRDKFSHVNAVSDRNSEEMVEIAERLSGLEIDGYVVTGFGGFMDLVDAFGGVIVDVPFAMAEPKSNAYLSKGVQRLYGEKALGFSRNRTISGGDFTRSRHQGMVILGGLVEVLGGDITDVPALLEILQANTWTNLPLGDLLNLSAISFEMDPAAVSNVVLQGSTGVAPGGASVVFLDEDAAALIFEDLRDGVLDDTG